MTLDYFQNKFKIVDFTRRRWYFMAQHDKRRKRRRKINRLPHKKKAKNRKTHNNLNNINRKQWIVAACAMDNLLQTFLVMNTSMEWTAQIITHTCILFIDFLLAWLSVTRIIDWTLLKGCLFIVRKWAKKATTTTTQRTALTRNEMLVLLVKTYEQIILVLCIDLRSNS